MILGNPAMIEAYQAGIPGNGKPFPDSARWRRSIGSREKNEYFPDTTVPVPSTTDFCMVKDSKRFADSGGWGWASSV